MPHAAVARMASVIIALMMPAISNRPDDIPDIVRAVVGRFEAMRKGIAITEIPTTALAAQSK